MSTLTQFQVGIGQTICPSSATITARGTNVTSTTFDTGAPLGSRPNIACGFLLCKTGGNTAWIVAPRCSQVSRTWYLRADAVTTANACSGCSGVWFVPTRTQLQNPGYICRQYWDLFSSSLYWSSTQYNATNAYFVPFNSCGTNRNTKTCVMCVRAFRCVTY
jgi:hypothetical protein